MKTQCFSNISRIKIFHFFQILYYALKPIQETVKAAESNKPL